MGTVVETAKPVIADVEIGGLRLISGDIETRIRSPQDAPRVEVTFSYGATLTERQEEAFWVVAAFQAHVIRKGNTNELPEEEEASEHQNDDDEPFIRIEAAFELSYRHPPGSKYSDDQLQAFADLNAVFNAWPYFREFAQSSMARMGLPPLTVPLFRLSAEEATQQGEGQSEARD